MVSKNMQLLTIASADSEDKFIVRTTAGVKVIILEIKSDYFLILLLSYTIFTRRFKNFSKSIVF